MRDWFAALAVGLVIVVGCAAGLGGMLAFLLAFGIAWYLFAARDLGFAQARDRLGIRLLPPIWRRSNWIWIDTLFEDGERLLKAATAALLVTGLALMFWPDIVYGAALLIAAFYVSEILRGHFGPRPRLVRIPDAAHRPSQGPQMITAAAPAPPSLSRAMLITHADLTSAQAPALSVQSAIRLKTFDQPHPKATPLHQPRKRRALRRRREAVRNRAAKRSAPAMRARLEKAKRPLRALPALPSRKPDYPIALRATKPRPQRPPMRRRTMRKLVVQTGRGTPKPAAPASR
ncbi:hypothetical protein LPW26_01585 [Rhodopseudomonas sp. HC1]|uniref:hypothetical protein n=1 Tax=Rhodopseudomonas infernalis TaxID=2897386 RepID=UPI001EE82887|nr:hypothetical protein [Rhodopseudomonas infernalis]MCG6203317.1 hypothetical protein [Rhodopseudomonas infernalis]